MTSDTDALLVSCDVEVDAPVAVAWRTWVEDIGRWWPTATELELTFVALGPDRCRLELRHRGWERRPDGVAAARRYETGWAMVTGRWADAVPAG